MPERKVIAVTGASSGIGRALALRAASSGFAVIAASRNRVELDRLAAEVQNDGGTLVPVVTDVTHPDAAARILTAAQSRFGRLDVLVHNAGSATAGSLLQHSEIQIDAQWQLHVASPLRITRAAFPLLSAAGGQVIFIGSGLRRVPAPNYGAYCAAKAAVEAMAEQLRRELRRTGIAVTFVDPGSVRTNFAKNSGILPHGPRWIPVSPDRVAQRILHAVEKRPRRLLAVPWHTLGAILGEWFPYFADRAIEESPQRSHAEPATHPDGASIDGRTDVMESTEAPPSLSRPTTFESALEPVARRMERVKLPREFLAQLLQPGEDVHLSETAMRWAGMPNKNERAAMAEALDALAAGGFLERTGEESWRVLRAAQ